MRSSLLLALLATPVLAACTANTAASGGSQVTAGGEAGVISVVSTADGCEISTGTAPAGTLTFDVTNAGAEVTEFYLLGEDGLRIVAEVENIGPALSRELTAEVPAGSYVTACKPGMTGEGIRADFEVTGRRG